MLSILYFVYFVSYCTIIYKLVLYFIFRIFFKCISDMCISNVMDCLSKSWVMLPISDVVDGEAVSLGEVSRLKQWHDVEVWPEAQSVPGILVFEFRGPLVFASAEWFEEEVERKRLQADIRVKFVILCIWVMLMCIFLFLFGGCTATTSLTLASSIGRWE